MPRPFSQTPRRLTMIHAHRSLFLLILPALCLSLEGLVATPASAQVKTGTPPFGSFGGGPDIINLATLNSPITPPILHNPARGTNSTSAPPLDTSSVYPSRPTRT